LFVIKRSVYEKTAGNRKQEIFVKIIIYCQHVLGVGHFFRTLEIAKALKDFDLVLVTGGGQIDVELPRHIRHVELPGLMMDENFTGLHSVDPKKTVNEIKHERERLLLYLIKAEKPDMFLIELYPFGRRAFRFELSPVLDFIRENPGANCKVVCSLRDILVEKDDTKKYENRVIDALNKWFDAVLIHSDPQLIKLDSTFSRLAKIKIPLFYTGFVTPVPDLKRVEQFRQRLGLNQNERMIVASAGGGNVGALLLESVIHAYNALTLKNHILLKVFTGPYMDRKEKKKLHSYAGKRITVEEFTLDFVSLLGAGDLCISMAGYNTCMNIVAAKIPSLVWPFAQNREQRERAGKLSNFSPMTILEDKDLLVEKFSRLMEKKMESGFVGVNRELQLNINGAANTMEWVKENMNS